MILNFINFFFFSPFSSKMEKKKKDRDNFDGINKDKIHIGSNLEISKKKNIEFKS